MRRPVQGCGAILLALALLAADGTALERDTRVGRWRLDASVEGYGVGRTERDSPRQRPEGIVELGLAGSIGGRVRPVLGARVRAGGPPEDATGVGVFNFRDTFQNISPSLEIGEAYADVRLRQADLRLGLQKFAWGRLDTLHPADVLNPRQYSDPFVTEEMVAKIAIPAVSATGRLPDVGPWLEGAQATVVWVPVPVPFRFPLPGERWFPPAAAVPPRLAIPPGAAGPGLPGAEVGTTLSARNAPAGQRLSAGAVGVRWSALTAGVDWSLYVYNGRETAPALDLTTRVRRAAGSGSPGAPLALAADAVVRPRYGHIWLAGADGAFELGGITARVEAVYGSNRMVPRSTAELLGGPALRRAIGRDAARLLPRLLAGETVPVDLGPLFLRRDVVEWGVGVDYPWRGWVPVLQVNQSLVRDSAARLLVPDVDTRLFGALRKSWLADRLATEVVGLQSFERSATLVMARLTWMVTGALRLRLGYLAIGGSANTVVGQFKANDELFLQLRYAP